MKQQNKQNQKESLIEFATRINKLGMKGPRDLSYNLDHYLYGAPKKKLPKELLKEIKKKK